MILTHNFNEFIPGYQLQFKYGDNNETEHESSFIKRKIKSTAQVLWLKFERVGSTSDVVTLNFEYRNCMHTNAP